MGRIRTTVVALLAVLAMAVSGGAGPARADTTGFGFDFEEPSAPHAIGTCNNSYCTAFPYGAWSPTWELRVYPAPGGTPTPVQVQWEVGEVKPTDPKHLVAGIDLQVDMGHGWQEAPDGPTAAVTIPSTATYGSPYIFYFRFKPILDAQQAVRICATLQWKASARSQSPHWGNNSCADDIVFTGTPPQSQPTSAPAPSSVHTSQSSPGRSTSPTQSASTATPARTLTPTTTTPTLTPTPTTATTPTTPTPTAATSPANPTSALSATGASSPEPSAPSPDSSITAAAAASSHASDAWNTTLLGTLGIVIAGGATATVLARRRRRLP